MMAGNPNWWSMNGMHPLPRPHFLLAASDSSPPHLHQDRPVGSWSQLLLGGLGGGEEERWGTSHLEQQKKLEDEVLNSKPRTAVSVDEESSSTQIAIDCYGHADEEFQSSTPWPRHPQPDPLISVSSPTSCITPLTNTIFSFSSSNNNQHHSSECNGSVSKKARAQQSSPKPALKVRKEKLGDRITALHQLVSPFGKTDTASVLSEAIGYIRFLEAQIEALSSPYMRNAAGNRVQERKCMLSEELSQDSEDQSDLKSRGLCLVPISCTQHVGNDISADFWAPAAIGRGF